MMLRSKGGLHKRLGHALALPSLAAVLRPLKISGQVPAARQGLRLFVQLDETQSHWIPFDLNIISIITQL